MVDYLTKNHKTAKYPRYFIMVGEKIVKDVLYIFFNNHYDFGKEKMKKGIIYRSMWDIKGLSRSYYNYREITKEEVILL